MSLPLENISSLLVVVGLSGAGKSTAMKTLEDAGWFCIENIPVSLLENVLSDTEKNSKLFKNTAILAHVDETSDLHPLIDSAKKAGSKVSILFLECSANTLLKRYSETRRPHPIFDASKDNRLEEAIIREREMLQPLKEIASIVIDTSHMLPAQLKRDVLSFSEEIHDGNPYPLRINFLSFGFKNGIPLDCDLVVDVRFLKNPYYIPELKERSGMDKEVADYVDSLEETASFKEKYLDLLSFLVPGYLTQGKAFLNVGIGCTGGQHRSVALAEYFSKTFKHNKCTVSVTHRDVVPFTGTK